MIRIFDHVFGYIGDNDLDATLARFERAGFSIGQKKVRHSTGRLTGFVTLSGSYLEFLSVVDEAEFSREAAMEDRLFRAFPQPFGIGAVTENAIGVHKSLLRLYPNMPDLVSRSAIGHEHKGPAWTFCHTPRRSFPGATFFAIQYHGRPSDLSSLQRGPNTIYALADATFCSQQHLADVEHWRTGLRTIMRVRRLGATSLNCGSQQLEWISDAEDHARTGRIYAGPSVPLPRIAAVKLYCSDLEAACQFLTRGDLAVHRRTATRAFFAPDANTGFTFELIEYPPARFLRRVNRPSSR